MINERHVVYHGNGKLEEAYNKLYAKTGEGAEMTGWLTWPAEYLHSAEYGRLKETAKKIRIENDAVVIIGIGGSYLTPKAVIDSEYGEAYNEVNYGPRIYYAGCDLSPDRLNSIIASLEGKDWSIIYISKSGGTMEPALAFRTLFDELESKYGVEANKRVYAITDAEKGILKTMANNHGWDSFVIPDNIGGRYSGLTACGLLPIAVAGIDTDALLIGASEAIIDCEDDPYSSFALRYAKDRFDNYLNGYKVELFSINSPDLSFFAEWLKQLFGESEGKDEKGIFPASVVFPRDLHSLGQFLQDGTKGLIFETFIIREFQSYIEIPDSNLEDNLDDYAGKKFAQAASAAMDGAYKAHKAGGNPCSIIRVGNTLKDLGYLMQSMFIACAIYCYMLDVNPFNQPAVELHKKNMRSSPEWNK